MRYLKFLLYITFIGIQTCYATGVDSAQYTNNDITPLSQISLKKESLIVSKNILELPPLLNITSDDKDSIIDRIGIGREIKFDTNSAKIKWHSIGNNEYVGNYIFKSQDAKALRVGIEIENIPSGVEFRFFGIQDDESVNQIKCVSGEEVSKLIQQNLNNDGNNSNVNTYWSPVIEGDIIGMEIYISDFSKKEELKFEIKDLSHIYKFYSSTSLRATGVGDSADCSPNGHKDFPCENDSDWIHQGKTVANYIFTKDANSYTCTGTLLNDKEENGIPYFITANHCVSSQTVASTISTDWNFEHTYCNSGTVNSNRERVEGGAKLLITQTQTSNAYESMDISLLKLYNNPPSGTWYSGWTANMPSINDEARAIHHPRGDVKKIAKGKLTKKGIECHYTNEEAGLFNCSNHADGNFMNYQWKDYYGFMQKGSSGSGIFNETNRRLLGVLSGSTSNPNELCSIFLNQTARYTSFSRAYYKLGLFEWLENLNDYKEPNNDIANATILTKVNTYLSIGEVGDEDWLLLNVPRTKSLTIKTNGFTGDTEMRIYNSSGVEIDYNDDGGKGLFSKITRTFAPGDYYIKINEYNNDSTLKYALMISKNTKYDFDSDSVPDIIWRNTTDGMAVLWFINANGTQKDHHVIGTFPTNWEISAVTDFNNDSVPDIIWRNTNDGTTVLWFMNADGTQDDYHIIGTFNPVWEISAVTDFNNDSVPDIIWRNTTDGTTVLWFMNADGTQQGYHVIGTFNPIWEISAVTDFNSDAVPDIIWRNTNDGTTVLWFMNADGTQQSYHIVGTFNPVWEISSVRDFNNDNVPDIIWRNTNDGTTVLWFMNANGTQQSYHVVGTFDPVWEISSVVDFNNDNVPDIIWRNTSDGTTVLWFMNADGTQNSYHVIGTFATNWEIQNEN